MSDHVLTEDLSSGRVHKRYRAEAGYMSHGADNLDSAGPYRVLTDSATFRIPDDRWCKRCFPNGPKRPEAGPVDTDSGPDAEDDASTQPLEMVP